MMPISDDKKVDHLILLVGGNPLPNYVAARVLGKEPQNIHLVHTAQTDDVAKALNEFIDPQKRCALHPLNKMDHPNDIYISLLGYINGLKPGSVGLHYTGGTKAMAAQAHRAARDAKRNVQLSYLDARTLRMEFENAKGDPVPESPEAIDDPRAALTVQQIMEMHGNNLKKTDGSYSFSNAVPQIQAQIADAILASDVEKWSAWIADNLRVCWDEKQKAYGFLEGEPLKVMPAPVQEFPKIAAVFAQLEAKENTFEEWARLSGFKTNKEGMIEFAKFMEGGWVEIQVFRLLEQILADQKDKIHDLGVNYISYEGKDQLFEFDVAATRGYRLFAVSCTSDATTHLCKSKLFEAYYRAGQMGGDEARAALVCGHKNPDLIYRKFRKEYMLHEDAARVFNIDQLKQALANPAVDERKLFANWLMS